MSAAMREPAALPPAGTDMAAQIAEALTRRCQLSPEAIRHIESSQRQLALGFCEVAMLLGHATPADLAAVLTVVETVAESGSEPLQPTARPAAELTIAHAPLDPRGEALRSLRTELQLRQDAGNGVVAVLGAATGEGRSRLAAELAIAFAQTGADTLLVDADLRRPRQHRLFGVDLGPGLSDALCAAAGPVLCGVDGLPRLQLLTAGCAVAQPLELLSSPRFTQLVDGWRRRYTQVVIDTPPIGEVADGIAVASAAGQVLAVFRAQQGLMADGRRLLSRLEPTQARVLGAVLNHLPA